MASTIGRLLFFTHLRCAGWLVSVCLCAGAIGYLTDSVPSFTLFRLYHRWSMAWVGLGVASFSYCYHFSVFGSWWAPLTYASAPFMVTQLPSPTPLVWSLPLMTATQLLYPNLYPSGLGVCLSPPFPQKQVDKVCYISFIALHTLSKKFFFLLIFQGLDCIKHKQP